MKAERCSKKSIGLGWGVAILLSCALAVGQAKTTATRPLTVMSYNIHHGADSANVDSVTSQAQAIRAAAPDFVGLQEVDIRCRRSGGVDQMALMAKITGMHSAFAAHFDYQGGQYGNGLLSRYPLSDVRNDRITLFTKDGEETRALLSAVATLDDGTTVIAASVHMALDQKSRLKQAAEIIGYLKGRGAPVILTGDFNAEPTTPELAALEKFFVNTGAGKSNLLTFPVGTSVKTIDYIMVDKGSYGQTLNIKVIRDTPYSDHYPLLATVKLAR